VSTQKCNTIMWCLLPDKQGATYTRLFYLLKQEALNQNLQLLPTTIHIDFEMAVIQAVRNEFIIEPNGCLFHFSQSILRHLQQNGLQVAYNKNILRDVWTWIRRMIALPLGPPLRTDQAFQSTRLNDLNVPGKDALNNYILSTIRILMLT